MVVAIVSLNNLEVIETSWPFHDHFSPIKNIFFEIFILLMEGKLFSYDIFSCIEGDLAHTVKRRGFESS